MLDIKEGEESSEELSEVENQEDEVEVLKAKLKKAGLEKAIQKRGTVMNTQLIN